MATAPVERASGISRSTVIGSASLADCPAPGRPPSPGLRPAWAVDERGSPSQASSFRPTSRSPQPPNDRSCVAWRARRSQHRAVAADEQRETVAAAARSRPAPADAATSRDAAHLAASSHMARGARRRAPSETQVASQRTPIDAARSLARYRRPAASRSTRPADRRTPIARATAAWLGHRRYGTPTRSSASRTSAAARPRGRRPARGRNPVAGCSRDRPA